MLKNLSRIVLPTSSFIDNTNLFFTQTKSKCLINNKLSNCFIYKFNTWMNIFPAKKYFTYCELENLFFSIEIDKDAELIIQNFNYNEVNQTETIVFRTEIKANQPLTIRIDNPQQCENLYFSLISTSDDLNIINASWDTDSEPLIQNKLAIVTCTFKRENYVKNNIALFNNFIQQNPSLSDRIKMFVVDNGKTLEKDIENENVRLYPNKNTGGAGGFTRGIIEAKNSNEGYTRILLMDDDVEIFPEAFYRTLILSDYLKPEYNKAFIHGAMLNMYEKNSFFESTALKTSNWCAPYHGKRDVSKPSEVAATNMVPANLFSDKENAVSSAWWYCCFSMESIKEKGLPLPVFFRCDDLEWSWRNFGEHHITANGICVWHAPFEWRCSKPVEYYFSKRNIIAVNMLHTPNCKKSMLKMLKRDFGILLIKYDYTSCQIYLKMMEDLLTGSNIYRKDPELVLQEVFAFTKNDKFVSAPSLWNMNKVKSKFEQYSEQRTHYRLFIYLMKKILWKATRGAKFIPQSLWRKEKAIWPNAPYAEYMLCRKLYLTNIETLQVEIREFDAQKKKQLSKQFTKLFKRFEKDFNKIEQDFRNSFEEFKTEAFWNKYLELEKR